MWWHMPVILVLKGQRQVKPRGLLDSQPNLMAGDPVPQKQGEKGQLNFCPLASAHMCLYMHMCIHKGISTECEQL